MAGEKILVVDDVGFNRLLLEKHLTSAGYEVEQAQNGQEAISLLKRGRYDLVITDLMMPKMDGLQLLTERLQQQFSDSAGEIPCPPFILCTANVGSIVTSEAVKKGFVDVLTKPVEQVRLLDAVRHAVMGGQDAVNINLIGNPATILKRLADRANDKPDAVVAEILEVLSLCDLHGEISSLKTLRNRLADKLRVDLSALSGSPEA